jgi:hypothetical protein
VAVLNNFIWNDRWAFGDHSIQQPGRRSMMRLIPEVQCTLFGWNCISRNFGRVDRKVAGVRRSEQSCGVACDRRFGLRFEVVGGAGFQVIKKCLIITSSRLVFRTIGQITPGNTWVMVDNNRLATIN